jgi:class 3 adenylate cyclase
LQHPVGPLVAWHGTRPRGAPHGIQDWATPTHAAGEGAGAVTRDLAGYVSRHLVGRLASGGPIQDFECTEARGAVLLTDIVDFTAHVERVTGASPAGIEELAKAFDAYFSDLVGLVYGHGGDVLAIAGDAFFSFWPAGTPNLRRMANLPLSFGA